MLSSYTEAGAEGIRKKEEMKITGEMRRRNATVSELNH